MAAPVAVLSQFQVGPVPDDNRVSRMALRLTYFDMLWLHALPPQRLLFYRLPGITRTEFQNDVVVKLRDSLSTALGYYLPMAGTLTIPPNADAGAPEILWIDGQSIALTAAESAADFDSLTGNHAYDSSDLHPLVLELNQTVTDSGSTVSAMIAVQITLFPGKGFSIGLTNHPAAGDGNTIHRFMRIWSTTARSEGRTESMVLYGYTGTETVKFFRATKLLPFYYRHIMEDRDGIGKTFMKQWDEILSNNLQPQPGISSNPSKKLRRTFSLSFNHIKSLKALCPSQSKFQVATAFAWSCLVKSREEDYENQANRLVCFADCRTRVHCLADWNYFGNCLAVCIAEGENPELVKEEGAMQYAARKIKQAIDQKMQTNGRYDYERVDGQKVRDGAKEWLVKLRSVDLEKKDEMVVNSPGLNFYKMRFCWARPVRFEYVTIDKTGAFSICGTRNYRYGARGGDRPVIEVCVCLPEDRMDAFAAAFDECLKSLPEPAEIVNDDAAEADRQDDDAEPEEMNDDDAEAEGLDDAAEPEENE